MAKNYPHTAQPLSEPRRHRIVPSKHNGTNNQINHEYKYEPDHTEPIGESHGHPTTGYRHTRRRTLPSPQLSPTFERRRTQIMENREQHVRQPQLAPTYERRQTTQVIENQERHVRQPVYLPKGLQYDGTTNWESFLVKFNRYADVSRWTTTERKDQLCWCLQGKASEFYTTIVSRDYGIDYFELIRKL